MKKSKRLKTIKKAVAVVIVLVCAFVFFACAIRLANILCGYNKASDFYDTLAGTGDELDTEKVPGMSEYVQEQLALFDAIRAEYPNVIGYINVPSVSIAYPVVQGTDNEYYVTHLVSGEESTSGSIFLDYRVSSNPSAAPNLVVYGHSMNNKTMFYNIRDLFDQKTFYMGWVDYVCESGVYRYAPFSVYVSTTSDPYYTYQFTDGDSFVSFCEERLGKSRFVYTDEYEEASRLITLVTCSNSISNPDERYVYHAILQEYHPRTAEE